ncbi:MAG: hypothetical protein WC824_08825 [Bacteroidota bacterium]|jgi:integrase
MKNQNDKSQRTIPTVTRRQAIHFIEWYTPAEMKTFFSIEMHPAFRRAFSIMLHTGIQICELVRMKPGDYTVEGDSIIATSDMRLGRLSYTMNQEYPLNDKLMNTILASYYHRPSMNHLFGDAAGKPLTARTLAMECRRIGNAAGIERTTRLQYFTNTFYHFIRYREDQSPFQHVGLS